MNSMELSKTLKQVEKVLLFLTFFLFPLVFWPSFTNIFAIPKLLLLAVVAGANLLVKAVRLVVERKFHLAGSQFDSPLLLLSLSYLLSVIIISPNKVEAIIDPNRGALLIVLLSLLVLTLPKDRLLVLKASLASLIVLFVATLTAYFSVLGFLPSTLSFINTKGFNLMGNLLSQALFAGFFLALSFEQLREPESKRTHNVTLLPTKSEKAPAWFNLIFIVSLLTFVLSVYTLLKDIKPQFFPLAESWQISVDTLKNARSALFGVGPANYLALYTRSKPLSVNNYENLWNLNVEYSRSSLLHLFSEVGLVGLVALGLILIQLYKAARRQQLNLAFAILLLWLVFFPVSQIFWFLLFLAVYLLKTEAEGKTTDLKDLDLFAYGSSAAIVAGVLVFGYFYYRAIASDYLVARSFVAAQQNQAQAVYDLQSRAITLNPYAESARNAFIQTNLVLANSLAQKKKPTESDRQQYTQLVQQAIANARDVATLNPQQADNWANLAGVYQVLLGQAQGAAEWTIASYQRSIASDPRNPAYYFNLGTVYYSLGNYNEAERFFEQAVSLKPNVANYYYNLGWAAYQSQDYRRAVNALETSMQFVKKGTDDYKKVKKELEEFKAKLPAEGEGAAAQELQPETLSQPTPVPTGQPTIKLPSEAAPPQE